MDSYKAGGVHGIVLIPDLTTSQKLIDQSHQLADLQPSQIRLNAHTSVPHITVAHIESSKESAEATWSELKQDLAKNSSLEASAFSLYLRQQPQGIWVGLNIQKTSALLQLHETTLEICHKHNLPITSAINDEFWPHITLSFWEETPDRRLPLEAISLITFPVTPALALMGELGTTVNIIDTYGAAK